MTTASYNKALRHTLGNKLFWLPHVPYWKLGCVVDFGCGDASLLKALRGTVSEDCALIGVERDESQRAAAKYNFVDLDALYANLNEVAMDVEAARNEGRPTLLVLSSVLHEVPPEANIWCEIEALGFDYIAIRDMYARWEYRRRPPNKPELEIVKHTASEEEMAETVKAVQRTVERWGYEGKFAGLLHGLLKSVYVNDFEREHEEDYFNPNVSTTIYDLVDNGPYSLGFRQFTITPFFRKHCERLGIKLGESVTTHVEVLLARRG